MSELRTFTIEIETEYPADYDLIGGLQHLAETVAAARAGGYRLVVAEDRDVIFTAQGGSGNE